MTEHIVAIFESEVPATEAAHELEGAGIPKSAIRQYTADRQTDGGMSASDRTTTGTTSSSGGGFWAWLLGDGGDTGTTRAAYPDETMYNRRAQAGNTVLSVTLADDSKIHDAVAILDAHHPIDVDESTDEPDEGVAAVAMPGAGPAGRTGVTRSGTDYSSGDVARSAPNTGIAPATKPPMSALTEDASASNVGASGPRGSSEPGREEVIPLSEEKMDVGTRTVDRGTTRVRRYVVEKPVEKDLTLHGERVTIERRHPAAGSTAPGPNAFEERTVEVHESEEAPVVEKSARVVEEVAIRREATERNERVRDTVRRDEVEISPDKPVASSGKPPAR